MRSYMNLVLTSVAVILVVIGIFVSKNLTSIDIKQQSEPKVLSDESQNNLYSTSSPTPPVFFVTPLPTMTPAQTSNFRSDINYYKYQNSELISESEGKMTLINTDNVDVITDWYKDRIKSRNINVKSFVKTKTNGDVLNKLAGASSDEEVNITIKQNSESSVVNIDVSLDSQ